jgi:hypothetical protein
VQTAISGWVVAVVGCGWWQSNRGDLGCRLVPLPCIHCHSLGCYIVGTCIEFGMVIFNKKLYALGENCHIWMDIGSGGVCLVTFEPR